MMKISKPATTANTRRPRPSKLSAGREITHRLLVALVAAPVFYGLTAQLIMLAQLLGACA